MATEMKEHIYQIVDQFPTDRLADLSRFLEQRLKTINTNVVNEAANQSPLTEHPSLKFAGIFKDDPNWDEFQAAIAESRREVDATDGVL